MEQGEVRKTGHIFIILKKKLWNVISFLTRNKLSVFSSKASSTLQIFCIQFHILSHQNKKEGSSHESHSQQFFMHAPHFSIYTLFQIQAVNVSRECGCAKVF